jgi:hypothetical protein
LRSTDEVPRYGGCAVTGVRPTIDSVRPLADAPSGFRRMADGDLFGQVVFTV